MYDFNLASASSLHVDTLGVEDDGIVVWLDGNFLFGRRLRRAASPSH